MEGREGGGLAFLGHPWFVGQCNCQSERNVTKVHTGTQEHGVCGRLCFGAGFAMAPISQEWCCPKPGSRNSSEGMHCRTLPHIWTLIRKQTLHACKRLQKQQKIFCKTMIYNRETSSSSVALYKKLPVTRGSVQFGSFNSTSWAPSQIADLGSGAQIQTAPCWGLATLSRESQLSSKAHERFQRMCICLLLFFWQDEICLLGWERKGGPTLQAVVLHRYSKAHFADQLQGHISLGRMGRAQLNQRAVRTDTRCPRGPSTTTMQYFLWQGKMGNPKGRASLASVHYVQCLLK